MCSMCTNIITYTICVHCISICVLCCTIPRTSCVLPEFPEVGKFQLIDKLWQDVDGWVTRTSLSPEPQMTGRYFFLVLMVLRCYPLYISQLDRESHGKTANYSFSHRRFDFPYIYIYWSKYLD